MRTQKITYWDSAHRESLVVLAIAGWVFPATSEDLPRQLMCGHETARAATYLVDHSECLPPDFGIIGVTVSGRGMIRLDECEVTVGPGQAFLLDSARPYRYWLPEGWPPWEFLYFLSSGEDFQHHLRLCLASAGPTPAVGIGSPLAQTIDRVVQELTRIELLDAEAAALYAYEVVMALRRTVLAPAPVVAVPVQAALDYLQSHLADELNVASLAQVAGLSRAHFTRLFQREVGCAPVTYVMRQRLHQACALLAHSNLSIQAISAHCGFTEVTYFYNRFKRMCGCTPRHFRLHIRNDGIPLGMDASTKL